MRARVLVSLKDEVLDPAGRALAERLRGIGYTEVKGAIFGKYIELDKGKKIVQEWKTTEWPNGYPPSIFELNLKKLDDGTEIEMIHSKVPKEQADNYDQGWKEYYWKPLKAYFKNKK